MLKVHGVFRLTADPVSREVNGKSVTTARAAIRTTRKDESGQYISNFYQLEAWQRGAQALASLSKGSRVYVSDGELTQRPYKSKEGQDRVSMDIRVTDLEFVDYKKNDDDLFSN